jgi:hypothetical protein
MTTLGEYDAALVPTMFTAVTATTYVPDEVRVKVQVSAVVWHCAPDGDNVAT